MQVHTLEMEKESIVDENKKLQDQIVLYQKVKSSLNDLDATLKIKR